jgi:hypothetical protein
MVLEQMTSSYSFDIPPNQQFNKKTFFFKFERNETHLHTPIIAFDNFLMIILASSYYTLKVILKLSNNNFLTPCVNTT